MSRRHEPEHKEGDTVRVLGTNRNNWHRWTEGDEVVLGRFDADDNSWWATDPRRKSESWIGAEDIEPAWEPPTEDEIKALFGIKS